MKKLDGYVCDICGTFFKSDNPITGKGKIRELHFCKFKCKSKWLKCRCRLN